MIRGEKYLEWEEQQGRFYFTERAYGRLGRAAPLPAEAGADGVRAGSRRGLASSGEAVPVRGPLNRGDWARLFLKGKRISE
jgi:hypothetical protein